MNPTRKPSDPLPREFADPEIYARPGVTVTDFDEMVMRMPRTGHFVGDTVFGDDNPITPRYPLQDREIPPASPLSPLGSLDIFPREILDGIIGGLDLQTLLNFRQVNQACMRVVDSFEAFKTIATFPKALSSVVTLKCFSFDAYHLASALKNTKCCRCRHFGDFLYLITAERLCYPCWRSSPPHVPKKLKTRQCADDLLRKVPHAWGLPGHYGCYTHVLEEPIPVFHRPSLLAYFDEDDDSEPETTRQKIAGNFFDTMRLLWYMDPFAIRFMVTMRAPYFDETSQSFVGGFFCRACFAQPEVEDRQRRPPTGVVMNGQLLHWGCPWRRYTREGFKTHLEEYGKVIKYEDGTYGHISKPTAEWMEAFLEQHTHRDEILTRQEKPENKPWNRALNPSTYRSISHPLLLNPR